MRRRYHTLPLNPQYRFFLSPSNPLSSFHLQPATTINLRSAIFMHLPLLLSAYSQGMSLVPRPWQRRHSTALLGSILHVKSETSPPDKI